MHLVEIEQPSKQPIHGRNISCAAGPALLSRSFFGSKYLLTGPSRPVLVCLLVRHTSHFATLRAV